MLLVIIAAVVEMFSVGMVLPFVELINNRDAIAGNGWLAKAYKMSEMEDQASFIIAFAVFFGVVYVLRNFYLVLVAYVRHKFVYDAFYSLASRLLRGYLLIPYTFHLQRNSAELIRILKTDANHAITTILMPAVVIVTEVLVSGFLLLLLLFVNPIGTLTALISLIMFIGSIYFVLRNRFSTIGEILKTDAGKMLQWISQCVGGIQESKVLRRQGMFLDAFKRHCRSYADARISYSILGDIPKLLVEAVVVVCMMLLIVVLFTVNSGEGSALPFLAMFGVAAVRIMPSSVRCYNAMMDIRVGIPSLKTIADDFEIICTNGIDTASESIAPPKTTSVKQVFKDEIRLDGIDYTYEASKVPSLSSIDIVIKKGQSVGIVGQSGAGKSTLLGVMLGLLTPTGGKMTVDGRNIFENLRDWQRNIGYIPQSIYLLDDTIRANIAFGLLPDEIEEEKIHHVISLARLDNFIDALPDGLDTVVGERGIRLSGGQRQRIAIARALYHDPDVLILDEATASLDNKTEQEITQAINALRGNKTLIIVAHRLSTIHNCDLLVLLKSGHVVTQGTYDSLMTHPDFIEMANVDRQPQETVVSARKDSDRDE